MAVNNKYQNGKIYMIYSNLSNKVYIGSTTRKVERRFKNHTYYYDGYKRGINKYCSGICNMFDELGKENCKIITIKHYPCNNKKELEREEGYYIKTSKNCYNKNVAGRNLKEYREDNKEKEKEKNKQYYNNNIEKIKQYREDNKEKIKQYKEDNKDKLKQQFKEYCEKNEGKIKQSYNCYCGGKYKHYHKSHHFNSLKHKQYLERKEMEINDINII
jgi:molecular chaperone DnaK (HSP70)